LARTWRDILHTFEHFLKAPHEIGAVLPSSRFLARRMMKAVDLKQANSIVELGAGTGAITGELLLHVSPGASVVIIDSNPEAVAILNRRLAGQKNLRIILGDARELRNILRENQIGNVDAIVSSLPYASLGEGTTRHILSAAADVLTPQGHFVAFQYTPLLRKTLEAYFEIQSSEVELRNFPPAVVYRCVAKENKKERLNLKNIA
jgi:phospholipid N-methyltransferase